MYLVRRTSDGAYLTKKKTWEEEPDQARSYSTGSAAANSLRQVYAPKEPFEAEVVEIEFRIVRTTSRYKVQPGGRYNRAAIEKLAMPRNGKVSTFRLESP